MPIAALWAKALAKTPERSVRVVRDECARRLDNPREPAEVAAWCAEMKAVCEAELARRGVMA
jgi:hypothetical protein